MRVIGVIPSRYGSSRFDGKPLAIISGKSMIQRVYESAAKANSISQVIVATDDQRIFDAVKNFNGQVLMTSPTCRSGTDRVAEAAAQLGLEADDITINIQGDQPMVRSECFDSVVEPLVEDSSLGMSTLAFSIVDQKEYTNPKDCKVVMDQNGYALYFSRASIPFARDDQPGSFPVYKHLGVYAYRCHFLKQFQSLPLGQLEQLEKLEQLRALEYGHRIKVVVTPFDSPEVDLSEDIALIEKKLSA